MHKILSTFAISSCVLFSGLAHAEVAPLSALEIFQGWQSLQLGKDFTQLPTRNHNMEQDNVLRLVPGAGELKTKEVFEDFELKFQWQAPKGAIGGIILNAPSGKVEPWQHGLRYFIADDHAAPKNKHPFTLAGSCFKLEGPKSSASKALGDWNQSRIVKQGNHYQFFLNGVKTADFSTQSKEFKTKVEKSPTYSRFKNFGNRSHGHIVIENTGFVIKFKNMKLRKLSSFISTQASALD